MKIIQDLAHPPTPSVIAAWIITVSLLSLILILHLLPALLAGLLVYELVGLLSPYIARHLPGQRSKFTAIAVLAALAMILISTAALSLLTFFRSDVGSLTALLARLDTILNGARAAVPGWALSYLPADTVTIQQSISAWLSAHAIKLQLAGTELGRLIVHVLLGMIIGAILSLRIAQIDDTPRPLSVALKERASRVRLAFSRIIRAQVRIASINALITTVYLTLILPLAGVHLPLIKTMIVITFVAGLIPVIGNLMSNSVIIIVSLSQSLNVALASLAFLLLIHKLEYFLNARIVGGRIQARAWELLIAMLFMEAAFGITGLLAAPIYYAYIKNELTSQNWI